MTQEIYSFHFSIIKFGSKKKTFFENNILEVSLREICLLKHTIT